MRRRQVAAVLGLVLGVGGLAGALAWIGRTALALEAAQAEAARSAALEEKVRLSLWRMDSALTPFVGSENARPVERFTTQPRTPPGEAAGVAEVYRRLARRRFEVDPARPVPVGREKEALPLDRLTEAAARATALPEPPPATRRNPPTRPVPSPTLAPRPEPQAQTLPLPGALAQQMTQQVPEFQLQEAQQVLSNSAEFQMRSNIRGQQLALVPPPRRDDPAPLRIETLLEPAWADGGLYLVRRVRREGEAVRWQGVEVDWPLLRGFLLDGVRDLLPAADLRPAPGATADPGRRLALLPVELVPGATTPPPTAWTPLRINLALSFAVIALVAVATAALFAASLRQSRRRADFVSAVTHELRTPLTTFRLYADLLAEDRVPREEHGSYLATLRDEAERLGHLVDNVLAYSRLERQPGRERLETLPLGELLARVLPGLEAAATRAGLDIVAHPAGDLETARVRTDPDAVERILQNLADNSAKYARADGPRRLELTARERGRFLILQATDHGPGIPAHHRRRLFRPFHRPAAEAAGQAPGVGLGLSLSRRLARSLGGDLRLVSEKGTAGAVFELWLRKG